jgi:glutathione S-transferase
MDTPEKQMQRVIQVLGRATSINVRKVLWLCQELGVACDQQPWGAQGHPTDTPDFRALNPNGKIPVIRDGEFILWESNAICRYLAAEHGRADLLPTPARERAIVEQWMDWQATELNISWRYAFMALAHHSPAHTDPSAVAASVSSWNHHMRMLDEQLTKTGAFAVGPHFTLADIVLGLSTHRWLATPLERPTLPAVLAYYERLSERPGFLAHGRNGIP